MFNVVPDDESRRSLTQANLPVSQMRSQKRREKSSNQVRELPAADLLSPVTLGIAHDLNNQLTGILCLSDLFLRETGPNSPLRKHLETIYSSGQRAAELVRRLYLEHQGQIGQSGLHDLNALARSTFELVNWALRKSVETTLSLNVEALPVELDAVAFRNAILRMAFAAAESGASTLEIRTFSQMKPRKQPSSKRTNANAARAACAIEANGMKSIREGKQSGSLKLAEQLAIGMGGALTVEPGREGPTTISLSLPQARLD
jgi:nitrogen-specific signal transduction histidine kinase